MTDEQRDALRGYIQWVLDGHGYINDYWDTLIELGVPTFIVQLIYFIGWVIEMIGGF
jgi:hypothetical protein